MKWTKDRPTIAGYYWWKETGPYAPKWKEPEPVKIFWYNHASCWYCDSWTLDLWMERKEGEFAGPIALPEDAPKWEDKIRAILVLEIGQNLEAPIVEKLVKEIAAI